jgi:hypothetical protein
MFVIDVLITATAASTEVRAFGLDAMRRAFAKIDKLGLGELFLFAHDLGGDFLAFDGEWDEDDSAVFPRDALSAKGDIFDG